MKTVAIIQARFGSTRLPGKVLRRLGDTTVLGQVVRRVIQCRSIDTVVVATSTLPGDNAVAAEADRLGVASFRGSEQDVLSRFALAAIEHHADRVVRITADCPLIHPPVVDQVVDHLNRTDSGCDYVSNVHPRTFPHGWDVEAFTASALASAHREATDPDEREHVTPFLYRRPDRFRCEGVVQSIDQSSLRWTLDEPADFEMFTAIFEHLGHQSIFDVDDVFELLQRRPEIASMNACVVQKTLGAA